MTGKDLALSVIQKYGINDITVIGQRAGIQIYYERWEAVTYGEFDRKKKSIHINLNAPVAINEILAHELGHYFVHQSGMRRSREEEEKMVEEFVRTIQTHFP